MIDQFENYLKTLQQQPLPPQQKKDVNAILDEFIGDPEGTISRLVEGKVSQVLTPLYQEQRQQKWEQQRQIVREKLGSIANQLEPEIFAVMKERPDLLNSPEGYMRAATEVIGKAYLSGVKQQSSVSPVESPSPAPKPSRPISAEAQKLAQMYGQKPDKVQETMERIVKGEFLPIGEE